MKSIQIISIISFFLSVLSCSSDSSKKKSIDTVEIIAENVLVADYKVNGMVCAMGCAKTIEDELLGMNGIADCSVDFESGKAHVEFDKTQLSETEIVAVIENLADGQYKVSQWKEENMNDEIEQDDESKKRVSEVSLPTIEIPNLFELLFNQL